MVSVKTLLASVAILSVSAASAFSQDRVVNVYNWSDYIDEEILTEFTAETGIKVVYDVFDSNDILETKLLAGSTGYDIVVPSATFMARQIQAGVFQPLDKSKLTNLGNLDPSVAAHLANFDPGNNYAINYMWGTTGIGYNVGKVAEALGEDFEPNTWDMVFDPDVSAKLKDCGIYVLDASDEVIPAALNYLGMDPDSKNVDDIAKGGELLLEARGNVRKFHSSEYINALANGDICVAVGWSGDVLQARDRAAEAGAGVEVEYTIPKEGALMWFDSMLIPADAKNVDEAHEFLDYLMRPEVMAKASNYVYYANGNIASKEFLEKDVIDDPAIYPDEATLANLYIATPYDQRTQRVVTRTWTKVLTGQ